jgi:predicted nucleotidyltransferase
MRSSNEPESDIEIYTELEDGEEDDYVKRLEEELRKR